MSMWVYTYSRASIPMTVFAGVATEDKQRVGRSCVQLVCVSERKTALSEAWHFVLRWVSPTIHVAWQWLRHQLFVCCR